MERFSPCMDILPEAQKAIWPHLAPLKNLGFVLYGGTAIALQIGHRESVDFDFFSSGPVDKQRILKKCPWLAEAVTIQEEPDTWTVLHGSQANTVKISFFGNLSIGRIGHPLSTDDDVLHVAELKDLFSLKLSVILKRAEAKDYTDIAALLQNGMDLSEGLAGAKALYGKGFQPSESLKALTYFEDGDLATLSDDIHQTLAQAPLLVGALPVISRAAETLL